MKRHHRMHLVLLLFILSNIFLMGNAIFAQLTVQLETKEDTKIIDLCSTPLDTSPQKIRIIARTNGRNVKFSWYIKIDESQVFQIAENTTTAEFIYTPSGDDIIAQVELATITVKARDDTGESVADSLKLILIPLSIEECRKKLMGETQNVEERFPYLQNSFIKDVEKYIDQINTERQERRSVNDELIPIIVRIINNLRESENIYKKDSQFAQRNSIHRKGFERELMSRLFPDSLDALSQTPNYFQESQKSQMTSFQDAIKDNDSQDKEMQRNDSTIQVIENIIGNLKEIESFFENNYKNMPENEIRQKIQRTRKTREIYEQEVLKGN